MTLSLHLPREIEERLMREAERQGLSAAEYAVQLIEKQLAPADRRATLVALLQSWVDADDGDEQVETGDYLVRVLDEDRLSDRRLFPPELKGVTW